jgi:hypothetical protein
MTDAATDEALTRITDFYTGAAEKPTAAQSAKTPRAEHQVGGLNGGAHASDADGVGT